MKTLLSLAIWILIFCEPLLTNGSPSQLDIKGQSSDHYEPTAATLKEIKSLLGTNQGIITSTNEHKSQISSFSL